MLSLLLVLAVAQLPCVQGETSVVCHCKQGLVSACEALRQTNPGRAVEIEKALQAVKLDEELRRKRTAGNTQEAATQASSGDPEPPECKGQRHHVISRSIAKGLEEHATLRGRYAPRDSRFVARAKDEKAHCGYQDWHRKVDAEVIQWLRLRRDATPEQFEKFLRDIYNRPEMKARFPHGF